MSIIDNLKLTFKTEIAHQIDLSQCGGISAGQYSVDCGPAVQYGCSSEYIHWLVLKSNVGNLPDISGHRLPICFFTPVFSHILFNMLMLFGLAGCFWPYYSEKQLSLYLLGGWCSFSVRGGL